MSQVLRIELECFVNGRLGVYRLALLLVKLCRKISKKDKTF